MSRNQIDLFGAPQPAWPEGFRYEAEIIDASTEAAMLEQVRALPFREFEFQGYTAKRRVVSFGWQYDFDARRLRKADDMPAFLRELRGTATRRYSGRSSASRCCRRARSGSVVRRNRAGSASHSPRSLARRTC